MDFTAHEIGDNGSASKESVNKDQRDFRPEYCHYRDEGCEYADACLECPFPQCLYDEPRGRQRWLKGKRNHEIIKLFSNGWKVKELALLFGVSQRTIQRVVNRIPKKKPPVRDNVKTVGNDAGLRREEIDERDNSGSITTSGPGSIQRIQGTN